jgi:hypothetical protein
MPENGKTFVDIIEEEIARRQVMKHDVCQIKLYQMSLVAEVVGIKLLEHNAAFVKSEIFKVDMGELVIQIEMEENQKAEDQFNKECGFMKIKKSFSKAFKRIFRV